MLFLRSAFKIIVKSFKGGEDVGFSELNLSGGYKLFFDPLSADKLLPVPADRGRPRCVSSPLTCKKWRTGAVETSAELVELYRQEKGHKFAVERSGLRGGHCCTSEG